MDVELRTPEALFKDPIRYVVPDYQRKYVWEQEKQWEPLLDDVLNLAEQAAKPARAVRPHFMGSIVLIPAEDPLSKLPTLAIVDGQQRLLTLQLMLNAARQECDAHDQDVAEQLKALVRNRPQDRDDNADHDFKMWPTDEIDQLAFRHSMRKELSIAEYQKERIVQAHAWFVAQIGRWLDERPRTRKRRAAALCLALSERLQLAVVKLDAEDDEQIVFETLNSRGTELGTFDLAKNFLLSEARKQGAAPDFVSKRLRRLENREGQPNRWWSQEIGSGRARRPHIDAFLHHWLAMETAADIPLAQTFGQFRKHVSKTRAGRIEKAVTDFVDLAEKYQELRTADLDRQFGDFVRRWKVLHADVFTPLILWLWANGGSNRRVRRAYGHIESYLVRRLICSLDTRGYGAITRQLLTNVKADSSRPVDEVIADLLSKKGSRRERWPTDSDVREALLNGKLLGPVSAGRAQMILKAIEQSFSTSPFSGSGAKLDKRRGLTIEHVMPQDWQTPSWPEPDQSLAGADETAERARERLIDSIGNLTLVNKKLNSRLGRAPWTRKSELYLQDEERLALNRDLLRPNRSRTPSVWDEEQIQKRSERLAKRVIEIWPRPS